MSYTINIEIYASTKYQALSILKEHLEQTEYVFDNKNLPWWSQDNGGGCSNRIEIKEV